VDANDVLLFPQDKGNNREDFCRSFKSKKSVECKLINGICAEDPNCESIIPVDGKCGSEYCSLDENVSKTVSTLEMLKSSRTLKKSSNLNELKKFRTMNNSGMCKLDECSKYNREECLNVGFFTFY
jgi:hypothetical protein